MSVSGEPAYASAALLLLMFGVQALKEMGIPSPGVSQSLLLYAGYQFSRGSRLLGGGLVLGAILGSLCGALLIFWLARRWGSVLLDKLNSSLAISPAALARARQRLTAQPCLAVALGRAIPGLLVPTSLAAGMAGLPTGQFLLGTLLSVSVWGGLLIGLGGAAGQLTPRLTLSASGGLGLLGALLVLGLAGWAGVRNWRRRAR